MCSGGSEGGSGGGGLATLFEMVLGGLVGTSPHMISASVMALARLLHQFAPQLGGVAPTLLPAVLMLLRTKSREVVKAVLGFVKVRAALWWQHDMFLYAVWMELHFKCNANAWLLKNVRCEIVML